MNISNHGYEKFNRAWWTLKLTYGLLYVVAGADKFTNLIVQWQKYLNPVIPQTIGIDSTTFMYIVGIIEIVIGLITLSKYTKLGATLVVVWFGLIVLNLLSMMTYFDIAVRDIVMAIGALVLICLTAIKEQEITL